MVFFVSVFDTKTCQQLVIAEAGFFIFIHLFFFSFTWNFKSRLNTLLAMIDPPQSISLANHLIPLKILSQPPPPKKKATE